MKPSRSATCLPMWTERENISNQSRKKNSSLTNSASEVKLYIVDNLELPYESGEL